jgi:hypothetical protein
MSLTLQRTLNPRRNFTKTGPNADRCLAILLLGIRRRVAASRGCFAEAITLWVASIEIDPTEASTRYHLARIMYKVQDLAASWAIAASLVSHQYPLLITTIAPEAPGVGEGVQAKGSGTVEHTMPITRVAAILAEPDATTAANFDDRYVRATVLHLLMLSVLDPRASSQTSHLIAVAKQWVSLCSTGGAADQVLSKQFNEAVRFAALVIRLSPFSSNGVVDVGDLPSGETKRTDSSNASITSTGRGGSSYEQTPLALPTHIVHTLGESHILPLAWCQCSASNTASKIARSARDGMPRLQFRPRLCVGLKGWHFSSTAPAREHETVRQAFASLPPRSTIVVFAGEIDLRIDGQLVHVSGQPRRARKYPNTSQGVVATARLFVEGLAAMNDDSTARHTVLIAPVRPPPSDSLSLDCRGAVVLWNSVVRFCCVAAAQDKVASVSTACTTGRTTAQSGSIIALSDVYPKLCVDPSGAREAEMAIDEFVTSAVISTAISGKASSGSKELERRTNVLNADPALVLNPEYALGDGAHLNRQPLPVFAASIATALLWNCT